MRIDPTVGAADSSFFFPSDGSERWLGLLDARLAVGLLDESRTPGRAPRVLEVGVYQGAWTSVVLANAPDASVVGVDPYPGLDDVREIMIRRLQALHLDARFRLVSSFDQLPLDERFDLVHIDGNHTEAAVWQDLTNSAMRLNRNGVIIVDDFNLIWFPGIASAMYRYCAENHYRVFLSSGSKAYLARTDDAAHLHARSLEIFAEDPVVRIRRNIGDDPLKDEPYVQVTDVLGQPVLIATEHKSGTAVSGSRLRRVVRLLIPPILISLWRRIRPSGRS
jgi:predicted O-methyltransferase YrrM